MIQFNINRFGKLACWTLRNDKRYYVKSFLQIFVVTLLIFLFFTMVINWNGSYDRAYRACVVALVMMFCVTITMGPAWMFYSMEGKHDMQSLMMLPASNFEKYLMRYSSFLILLPIYVVGPLLADLLQYLIHLIVGHDYGRFVVSVAWKELFVDTLSEEISKPRFVGSVIVVLLWIQSLYALGATLFRTRKFNWIITTVVLILLVVLLFKNQGRVEAIDLKDDSTTLTYATGFGIYLAFTMINYWLSYRFFCRTQVIGKFVNL
ncbi:MAG: hypothetical protein IJ185_04975 [Prevotella sp.]|nr:hypothetical protein [Prevotella sp.]